MFDAGIWTILFWLFVGLAIGGLISWLMGARTDTETAQGFDPATLEGARVTVNEEFDVQADQLEAIEGIGPKISALFHSNGIHRFAQVAAMTPMEITKVLKAGGTDFDIARPYTWPFQARLLENGWINEFMQVKEELRAGRNRLHGIDGISDITAERLHGIGYGSLPALEEAEPALVVEQLAKAHESVPEAEVKRWIDEARRVLTGDPGILAAAFGLAPAVVHARKGATYADSREVAGTIVNARGLAGLGTATATATARPSLLPFWIGLLGAALMALLSSLGGAKPETVERADSTPGQATVLSTELGSDALFETDSAVLTDAGKAEIDQKIIGPARGHNVTNVKVVGHADVRGDDAHNLTLSRERAASVASYLKDRAEAEGITWNTRAVEVFGAGEEFPNPKANTAEDCASFLEGDSTSAEASACFAPDRRVTVDIIAAGS